MSDISILDVGHGNSTVLHDNDETIVIDCGSHGAGLLQYLQDRNITSIKRVFLSHADQDHIGGLLSLLASNEVSVSEVYLNSDGSKGTKLWEDLITILDDRSRSRDIVFEVSIHEDLKNCNVGNILLKVAGPSKYLVAKGVGNTDRKERKITSNSISASFLVIFKEQPLVLISGDIDQISLDEINYTGQKIQANVLVFPHHGGKIEEGNIIDFTQQLLTACTPKTIIFSIGRKKFKNPRPEIIKVIRERGIKVRIACTQLSTNCSTALPTNEPNHLHAYYAKGRSLNECCGGTYVISVGEDIKEFPDYDAHQEFIIQSTETALCRITNI